MRAVDRGLLVSASISRLPQLSRVAAVFCRSGWAQQLTVWRRADAEVASGAFGVRSKLWAWQRLRPRTRHQTVVLAAEPEAHPAFLIQGGTLPERFRTGLRLGVRARIFGGAWRSAGSNTVGIRECGSIDFGKRGVHCCGILSSSCFPSDEPATQQASVMHGDCMGVSGRRDVFG